MQQKYFLNNTEFETNLKKIAALNVFDDCMNEIIRTIATDEPDRSRINEILSAYNIRDISDKKEDALDLLLLYVSFILQDGILSKEERANLKVLKMLFKIREGDFYQLKYNKIRSILKVQFQKIYEDDRVDDRESLFKVALQELFDLSYDQFQELSAEDVRTALNRGADLDDLDAVIKH